MVVIFFNENNIDSLLAVHILRDMFINTEPETEVKLYPYDRILDNFTPQACNVSILLGVSMRDSELIRQQEVSGKVVNYSYDRSNLEHSIHNYHPYLNGSDVEEVFDRSLSKILIHTNHFQCFDALQDLVTEYIPVVDVVFKYANFIKMNKFELELFYQYQEAIKESYLKPFAKLKPAVVSKNLTDQISLRTVRKLVTRNMDTQLFGDTSKNKMLPAINLNQEHLIDAVRQIQYAHASVVVYEDVKHYRQWVIYNPDKNIARELIDLIPHIEKWEDNRFIFLISEQAKFVK